MKVRRVLAVAVLLAVAAAGGWLAWDRFGGPVPPEIPLDGADAEMTEAVGKALEAVRSSPRSAEAWGELCKLLIANGFYDKAVPCLVQTERLDPAEASWPYWHGLLLLNSSPREAIVRMRQALALADGNENRAAILFSLVRTLIEEEELDEAAQRLQTLRAIQGDSPAVHYGLGLLAMARGDHAGARLHLGKLVEGEGVPAARKRACSLLAGLMDGDVELARKYQERAATLPNDSAWPSPYDNEIRRYKRTGGLTRLQPYYDLMAQGRTLEALAFLRQLAVESPDEIACFTLGFALFSMKEHAEAAQALRQAIGFNPRNVKSHLFLGAALLAGGEKQLASPDGKEKARELFLQAVAAEDEALRLQSDLALAHLTRGKALKFLGRTDEALAALRQAALTGPEVSEAHLALGEALAQAGQVAEGLKHLESAVRVAKKGDTRAAAVLKDWQEKSRKSSPSGK